MEHRTGTVIEVRNGRARIRFSGRPACSNCARGLGCGLGPLISLLGSRSKTAAEIVLPASGLDPGQPVTCAISGARVAGAAALAYLVPLAGMFAGAVAGSLIAGSRGDLAALAGAGAGLAAGWFVLVLARGAFDIRAADIRLERAPRY